MTNRRPFRGKPPIYEHLYPQIKEWFDHGWTSRDIAEELCEMGESITADTVRQLRKRIMDVSDSGDAWQGGQWEKHALDVWFERLRLRWKREGRI